MNILVPLGGVGQRFVDAGAKVPKPLVLAGGKEIVLHLAEYLASHVAAGDTVWFVLADALKGVVEDVVRRALPEARFVSLPQECFPTLGAADTVSLGLARIDPELLRRPCLLLDGDQFYTGGVDVLAEVRALGDASGAVVCFEDAVDVTGALYSYVEVHEHEHEHEHEHDSVLRIAEKRRISNMACTGAYYFADTRQLMCFASRSAFRSEYKEFYTSCVIAAMLEAGLPFAAIEVPASSVVSLGTPQQVADYEMSA